MNWIERLKKAKEGVQKRNAQERESASVSYLLPYNTIQLQTLQTNFSHKDEQHNHNLFQTLDSLQLLQFQLQGCLSQNNMFQKIHKNNSSSEFARFSATQQHYPATKP